MDQQKLIDNLQELRKNKGLTQKDLAEKIPYSDKVISKWERGESLPQLDALIHLSDYYGVSLNQLCGIEEHNESGLKKQLDIKAKKTHHPIFLYSILLPIVFLVVSLLLGQYMILSLSILLGYSILYYILTNNQEFTADYKNTSISVKVNVLYITLAIDGQVIIKQVSKLTSQTLQTSVKNKTLHVQVATIWLPECYITIE
jgi:transcriptional regulator with XRE-family HTH domain